MSEGWRDGGWREEGRGRREGALPGRDKSN